MEAWKVHVLWPSLASVAQKFFESEHYIEECDSSPK